MNAPRLTIELVPSSSWYTNLRSFLPKQEWNLVRRAVYRRAQHRCEICGGRGEKHPVECHEVWRYDAERSVQSLERLIALCPACHRVKHIGLAMVKGLGDEATRHLARVNGWTLEQARAYVDEAFDIWEERSQLAWTVDVSLLASRKYELWIERQKRNRKESYHETSQPDSL